MLELIAVEGTPAVQRTDDGRFAIWVGDVEAPKGLVIDAVAAVTLAQRLVVAVEDRAREKGFVANLERVRIFPPEQGAAGRLIIDGGEQQITFLIDWADLSALADTAKAALMTAPPAGGG